MDTSVWQEFIQLPVVEIIAAAFGVLSVWMARANNILVFPTGIISVTLYVFICFQFALYADAMINVYYLGMSIYGWYFWLHGGKFQHVETEESGALDDQPEPGKNEEKAHIEYNTFNENLRYLAATTVLSLVIGLILSEYTDSDVPWVDAVTTSLFFTAMYAMARKKIEHWIFWILGDAISIPLYIYKGLQVTALQYVVFLILAIWGFLSWYRILEKRYRANT